MLQLLKPKIRPRGPSPRARRRLSTVMKLEESSDPKKSAFQLLVPAWTAAA